MPQIHNAQIYNLKYGWRSDAKLVDRSSPWGNPFIIGLDGTRDEVCDLFETYAEARLAREPHWLDKLRGRDLLCHCRDPRYPRSMKRCHAETLIRLANPGTARLTVIGCLTPDSHTRLPAPVPSPGHASALSWA